MQLAEMIKATRFSHNVNSVSSHALGGKFLPNKVIHPASEANIKNLVHSHFCLYFAFYSYVCDFYDFRSLCFMSVLHGVEEVAYCPS